MNSYAPPHIGRPPQQAPVMTQHGPYVPPVSYPQPPAPQGTKRPMQRPVAVAAAACMTISGTTTWLAGLGLTWLTARYGRESFNTANAGESALYYILQRYDDRLTAIWPPLIGFPIAAFLVAFLLPTRSRSPRRVHTLLGIGACAFIAWWWWGVWWAMAAPIAFIALAVLLVWTPAANRWFRG
ncbi:MAG TPA: hypothetical protein PKM36_04795 [Propionibacteriaceae bacterium]|nr:hypothetical protein [Propionibacteriaceae bacterium]